jgi:hypothetical protein
VSQRKDYFGIPRVPKSVFAKEIQNSYNQVTKKYHPDTSQSNSKGAKNLSTLSAGRFSKSTPVSAKKESVKEVDKSKSKEHDSITTFAALRDDVFAELNHHEKVCLSLTLSIQNTMHCIIGYNFSIGSWCEMDAFPIFE